MIDFFLLRNQRTEKKQKTWVLIQRDPSKIFSRPRLPHYNIGGNMKPNRYIKLLVLCSVLIWTLAACALPNLKPFADATV